ncbi:hypothetical protein [Streptomyces decoyicus]|uniref:hypothetical protein n=1 Tax=Streptomyces decoyicus TaxID=249567 RepID=UPI0036594F30
MQTLHLAWNDACATLLYRRVDAVVTRLPFPTDQLHLGHCLAGKESVTLDDIADGRLPRAHPTSSKASPPSSPRGARALDDVATFLRTHLDGQPR